MDKKVQFKLKLEGKEYRGHLEFWTIDDGDLSGIREGACYQTAQYVLGGRDGKFKIHEDYAVADSVYYTLGEKTTHSKIVDIVAGKVGGKYHDPNFTTYKLDGWPD